MYYILYPLFYLLSLIPFWVMYRISDAIYALTYYVFGYRKKVVLNNLLIAFPEKTEKERIRIAKDFYHQLIDTFLETIKMISISREELNKRFVANYEVVNEFYQGGQNVQLHAGHFFNWEYVNLAYSANLKFDFLGVYMPLTNKVMNKIIVDMRSKFGTILIPAYHFKTQFHQYVKNKYALALAADQNPGNPLSAYWTTFFGKMAPFITGPERGAISQNTAIFFSTFYRIKRGYYKSEFTLFTTTPQQFAKGEITKAYRDFIENEIRLRPANYLWSHRRWKFEFDETKYGKLVI